MEYPEHSVPQDGPAFTEAREINQLKKQVVLAYEYG